MAVRQKKLKFSVKKLFLVRGEGKLKDYMVTSLVTLGTKMEWEKAKDLRKKNKDSYIVKE